MRFSIHALRSRLADHAHHHGHGHHHHHDHEAHRGGGRGGRDRGEGHGFFGRGGRHGGDLPGDPGAAGFGRGRKLGSDDLQLLLLSLLGDKPSHGYELIKQLEERSGGYYTPSPGMVYPALTWLEEIGHASVELDGSRKRYSLTDEGRAQLDAQKTRVASLFEQLDWIGKRMEHVREAMQASDGDDTLSATLHEARHAIRDAVHAKRRAPLEEQQRIAAILLRAAADILGK